MEDVNEFTSPLGSSQVINPITTSTAVTSKGRVVLSLVHRIWEGVRRATNVVLGGVQNQKGTTRGELKEESKSSHRQTSQSKEEKGIAPPLSNSSVPTCLENKIELLPDRETIHILPRSKSKLCARRALRLYRDDRKVEKLLKKQSPLPLRSSNFDRRFDSLAVDTCDFAVWSTRSAKGTVSSVIQAAQTKSGISASSETWCLVESLVWPIVSARSLRKVWFNAKDYSRLIKGVSDMAKRIDTFSRLGEGWNQTYIKYWNDLLLHKCMKSIDEAPAKPQFPVEASPLYSGFIHRQLCILAVNSEDVGLCYSMQKGTKQAWPALADEKQQKSLRSHSELLSTDHGIIPRDLRMEIERIVNELYGERVNGKTEEERYPLGRLNAKKFVPRATACLQANCKAGGALSMFETFKPDIAIGERKRGGQINLGTKLFEVNQIWTGNEKKFPFHCVKKHLERIFYHSPLSLKKASTQLETWRSEQFMKSIDYCCERVADRTRIVKKYYYYPLILGKRDLSSKAVRGLTDVDIVSLPEPGKFRTISKGDGAMYTALQPLQGLLLAGWKNHPTSTMLHPDLTDLVRVLARLNLPLYYSGDYQAATDSMKKDATRAVLQALQNLSYQVTGLDLAIESLMTPGVMRYGSYKWTFGVGKEGVNPVQRKYNLDDAVFIDGQLMGHPLSFAILCIVNLACYRIALRRWCLMEDREIDPWTPDDKSSIAFMREMTRRQDLYRTLFNKVIVNGDDILFATDVKFAKYFDKASKDAGFVKSVGKNYISPYACMANSQMFIIRDGVVKRVGYLNQNLLMNNSIKKGDRSDESSTPDQIARDISAMVKLDPRLRCCVPRCVQKWDGLARSLGMYLNWYLPKHLGGYGIDFDLRPSDWRVTTRQLQLASQLVNNPRNVLMIVEGKARRKFRKLENYYLGEPQVIFPGRDDDYAVREEWELRSAWRERIMLYERLTEAGRTPNEEDSLLLLKKFKRDYRLQPMQEKNIEKYLHFKTIFPPEPVCPPLNHLDDGGAFALTVGAPYTILSVTSGGARWTSKPF